MQLGVSWLPDNLEVCPCLKRKEEELVGGGTGLGGEEE